MISRHGGARTSSTNVRATTSPQSQYEQQMKMLAQTITDIFSPQNPLRSMRKVRKIVTVSGQGVRGAFPSFKAKHLEYESLCEQDVLRVCEVASSVSNPQTQPSVLEFDDEIGTLRYTPDLAASISKTGYYIEVKHHEFARSKTEVARLRKIIHQMRKRNVPFILILESDVRANGLQEELRDLLSKRPCRGHFDPTLDTTLWDPRNHEVPDTILLERWHKAQQTCDELLARVMRRDPDALIDAICP